MSFELVDAHKFTTHLGGFGSITLKPVTVFTTHDKDRVHELLRVHRQAALAFVKDAASSSERRLTTESPRAQASASDQDGARGWGSRRGTWIRGSASQRSSARYPVAFCQAVAQLVMFQRA
eukprot:6739503-Pyramimonas_sp.AAC.1